MRRGVLWVAAAALTVAGAVVAVVAHHGERSPGDVVRAYFTALEGADAPAALALGDVPAGEHAFLTSEVLRVQRDVAALTDVHVDAVTEHGSSATVDYSYAVGFPDGPRHVTGSIGLEQGDGGWRLDATAVPARVQVTRAQNLATLAGAALPGGTVLLFPGAVPLRFATPYLSVTPDSGAVGFGDEPQHSLVTEVSPAGESALRAALAHELSSCFSAAGHPAADCPLPVGDRVVPGSLTGTLSGDVAKAADLSVDGVGDGRIRVTGSARFSGGYRVLDFQNLPHARHGTLTLDLEASAAPLAPAHIVFGGTS